MKKLVTSLVIVTLIVAFNITSIYAANLNANVSVQEVEVGKTFRISICSDSKLTDFEVSVNNSSLGTPTVVAKYNNGIESEKGTQKIVRVIQIMAQSEKEVISANTNLATFEYTVPADLEAGSYNITVTLKAVTASGDTINESDTQIIKVTENGRGDKLLIIVTIVGVLILLGIGIVINHKRRNIGKGENIK